MIAEHRKPFLFRLVGDIQDGVEKLASRRWSLEGGGENGLPGFSGDGRVGECAGGFAGVEGLEGWVHGGVLSLRIFSGPVLKIPLTYTDLCVIH